MANSRGGWATWADSSGSGGGWLSTIGNAFKAALDAGVNALGNLKAALGAGKFLLLIVGVIAILFLGSKVKRRR